MSAPKTEAPRTEARAVDEGVRLSAAERGRRAYHVEAAPGTPCPTCHGGALYDVVGPDDVAIGMSFEDIVDAEETAAMLNAAYGKGALAASTLLRSGS